MSNGFLIVAEADRNAAYDLGDGFGLDVIGAATLGDHEATLAALVGAANVGVMLSNAAAQQADFVALLRALATRLGGAQLIVVEPEARAAFGFLPEAWPTMAFQLAHERAVALISRRQAAPSTDKPPHAAPLPPQAPEPQREEAAPIETATEDAPTPEIAPEIEAAPEPDLAPELEAQPEPPPPPTEEAPEEVAQEQQEQQEQQLEAEAPPPSAEPEPTPPEDSVAVDDLEASAPGSADAAADSDGHIDDGEAAPEAPALEREADSFGAETPAKQQDELLGGAPLPPAADEAPPEPQPEPESEAPVAAAPAPPQYSAPPASVEPPPQAPAPAPAPSAGAPAPAAKRSAPPPERAIDYQSAVEKSAPADATAFAPKKVRRGTPELVRIAIHQPKDLKAVIKAARQIDPRTEPAPQGMSIGDVALGAKVGVSLEVRGAACDGAVQRRTWRGDPIEFNFSIEAEADVKQIVVLARVFVDDAQIGVLAFTRPVIGADKKPQGIGDKVRLKRHKRVFLSYSSKDRETVAAIATAYASAGVEHFWDRASLKSGEEWSPRLRKEIERADLFHLCWSKSAASSEWVEKEASHALSRRRRSKKPDITVQMLDGPPWAKHPDSLDSINFDDFVRAAIVGYARGDGET
jgi:hypothetical protein